MMGDTQLPQRAGGPRLSAPTERSASTKGWSHDSRERGESRRMSSQIGSFVYFVNLLIRGR